MPPSSASSVAFPRLSSAFGLWPLTCCLILSGCSPRPTPPPVDGGHAMGYVSEFVAIGPRPSGGDNARKAADWIAESARKLGYSPVIDTWTAWTPEGPKEFRNVEIVLPGASGKGFILLASHYDTKKMADCPAFIGANDSGSSTGLLLELLRTVAPANSTSGVRQSPFSGSGPELRFLFFDGEECIESYSPADGLQGSRHYAEKLEKTETAKDCRAMILLDMVGDRDFNLTLSADTPAALANRLFRIAEQRGVRNQVAFYAKSAGILDDHTPFQQLGIPCIDLIDFDYGPEMAWWHTKEDTLDKLSPKSLQTAGTLALDLVWELAR